jgi:hypothetical protein
MSKAQGMAVTDWCYYDSFGHLGGHYFTEEGRYAFCRSELVKQGWILPEGPVVAVRLQMRSWGVDGASCDVPSGHIEASTYIIDTLRNARMGIHDATFWWPEICEEY